MAAASSTTKPADALRLLRERFRATSANTVDAFRRLARQLASAPDAPEVVEALRRELHRVHGTAGSYGFMDASRLAARVEERAIRWAAEPALERDQRATIVEHFASALGLAFEQDDAPAAEPSTRRALLAVGLATDDAAALRSEATLRGWRTVVIEPDAATASAIADSGAYVVVCGNAVASTITGAAAQARLPCIVLVRGDRGEKSRVTEIAGSVIVLDAAAGPSAVIDVTDRLALRTTYTGATVLVVDDDDSILAMARFILEGEEMRVVTLDDPAKLAAAMDDSPPSLLLMDIQMGAFNGVEIVRELRAAPATRDLPVILFSSELDASTREAAYRAGADEFIAKPVVAGELRARISERLERHRLSRIAAGLHAATALPLPERTARDAAEALAALHRDDRPATIAVLRPDGGETLGEGAGWLRETRRVADAIGARFTGYTDGMGLLIVAESDPLVLAKRLDAVAAEASGAPWHAGLASGVAIGERDFDVVRRAAEDALAAARIENEAAARVWSRETGNLAPDVIVVEDDRALADMLQFALRSTGLTHQVFNNGRAALDAILAMHTLGRRPLLLLDVDLPGLDGYSLHERLRVERPGGFHVVYITVHAAEAEQIRALRAGALDYIVKPLNLRILMAKVPLWVERTRR